MFKVNNIGFWRRSGFFIVNFDRVLVFILLTLNVIVGWESVKDTHD